MNPSTIDTNTFTFDARLNERYGERNLCRVHRDLHPIRQYRLNTTYTATITTGAKDLAGIRLASN